MIVIITLEPPLARPVVNRVRFPARVIDATSFEPDGPAHVLVCRDRGDVIPRIEEWLTAQGYRCRTSSAYAPMSVVWQRWMREQA
jgi:hypothetical protein